MQAVRPGNQPQAAVLGRLWGQGQPHTDKFRPLVRPVADVLVPARVARVSRLLGHDAVVMGQRHHHARPQQLPQPIDERGRSRPFDEAKVARQRLLKAADRVAAGRFERGRGTGVMQVGLVLDRGHLAVETVAGDFEHSGKQRVADHPPRDEVTVSLELCDFGGRKGLAGRGGRFFVVEVGRGHVPVSKGSCGKRLVAESRRHPERRTESALSSLTKCRSASSQIFSNRPRPRETGATFRPEPTLHSR